MAVPDFPPTHAVQVDYAMYGLTDGQLIEGARETITISERSVTAEGGFALALGIILERVDVEDGNDAAYIMHNSNEFAAYMAEIRKRVIDRHTAQGRLF